MPYEHAASGHVFAPRRQARLGLVREVPAARRPPGQKRLGPPHIGRGRPPEGAYTERTARAALDALLGEAEAGELPQQRTIMPTFAEAAAE
jgi:hypothetical protein